MAGKFTIPYRNELIAVVIVITSFVMVKGRIKDARAKLDHITGQIQACEQQKQVATRWEKANADLNDAVKIFVFEDSFAIKKIFQEKAWSNDINVDSLQTSQNISGIVGEGYVEADISGEFKNIVNFIKTLEDLSIRINRISISGSGKKKSVHIVVQSFFNKEAAK